MTTTSEVPTTTINFQDPNFVLDPYSALTEVRRLGPIVKHECSGQYLVTGYGTCARVFGNAEKFACDAQSIVGTFGGATMESIDDRPRHDRIRGVWAHDFLRTTLDERRQMITDVVNAQLGPFVEKVRAGETVEAVSEMIRGIPTIVIAKMLGIPEADHRQFSDWSDAMGRKKEGSTDPTERGRRLVEAGLRATSELNDYMRKELADRRAHPTSDLVSAMVNSPVAEEMTEAELVASNTQLVFAGNETTAKLMAHILLALSQHPDQLAALRSDRSLIPQAIEEIHRWNSIMQAGWRFACGDHEVARVQLKEGDAVMCLQGMANRDPERWEDPDRLDIFREPRQHMGFGFGLHSCLGLNLARLETQVWLDRLLDELPVWNVESVDWGGNWLLRGPFRLHVNAA